MLPETRKLITLAIMIVLLVIMSMTGFACNQGENMEVKTMDESKIKEEVWQIIQTLNRAWAVEENVADLKKYFHKNMVAITPTDRDRLEGRDVCIASWKKFVQAAKIIYWREIDPKIQLYSDGKLAVVTYYYDMSYEMSGKTINTGGRDMFILANENGKWWVVADQFSPYPKQ